MEQTDFLGRGISFPPRVDRATGRFIMCNAEDDIRQSVYIILMTKKHEYAMLPDFGCNLHDYVFGLPDSESIVLAKESIKEALDQWEPRITDVSVSVDLSGIPNGKAIFEVAYTIRRTNLSDNFVFPYYLYEGPESQ